MLWPTGNSPVKVIETSAHPDEVVESSDVLVIEMSRRPRVEVVGGKKEAQL